MPPLAADSDAGLPDGVRVCIESTVLDGMPAILGSAPALFQRPRRQADVGVGVSSWAQRVRVDATSEIAILEIGSRHVIVAIETSPDSAEGDGDSEKS